MNISDLHRRVIGSASKQQLLLDEFPNAAAAYSLRLLSSSYTGNCIEVRRSSDNALQNIGFVNGVLDTASLLSFVGAGNGFVRTWYDQSGNVNDCVQTNNNAPLIVINGDLVKNTNNINSIDFESTGGRVRLEFTQKNAISGVDYIGVFTMYQNLSDSVRDFFGFTLPNNNARFVIADSRINPFRTRFEFRRLDNSPISSAEELTASTTDNKVMTFIRNYANASNLIRRNGVITISSITSDTGLTATSNAGTNSGIGSTFNNTVVKFISEIILYNTNQDDNIIGIESNINDYYNIF
jgi:hypothetical protein